MTQSRILYIGIATVLIAAVGLIIYGQSRPLNPVFHGTLAELLPPAPPGWTRTTRSIADSPEMKNVIDELLNYDDGVFYDYTNGHTRLSVYVAYWKPGKMSARLVAGHTPDVCWIEAGWICTQRGQVSPKLPGTDIATQPAEARTFSANTSTEYVWFWHLVDGVSESYDTSGAPPWYAFLADISHKGLNQKNEQFFVRLSSASPLTAPSLRPALNAVLTKLPLIPR